MSIPLKKTKLRLAISMFIILLMVLLLITRLGYLQVVIGEDLKKQALEQCAEDIRIKPERGTIYDRKGKKLSISINGYKIECIPPDVGDSEETANILSEILNVDKEIILNKVASDKKYVKIKEWVEKEVGEEIEEKNIKGIVVVPNVKRYYPLGTSVSYILGFTDIDGNGLYGVEKTYDDYLRGIPGRLIINVDTWGRQLPYDNERLIEDTPGYGLVLTIDETIQHFAEEAILNVKEKYKAKRATVLVMEPKTGDILAMASKPDYDPNQPKVPQYDEISLKWNNLSEEELEKEWNKLWKPHPVTDSYEPGSTFKIITAAAALEENVVKMDTQFNSDGYVRDIPGGVLKCWSYRHPHGLQTFAEGVQNSCNPVLIEVSKLLGQEKMLKYLNGFGFGERTGIDLLGEGVGSIPSDYESMREIRLATISYGQGISVTPIQLITAISSIANQGQLMKPRIVKNVVDEKGNIIEEIKPEMVRKVISKETSEKVLEILEGVVKEGTGKKAYVSGYRVGGKTGTAQKVVNGEYSDEKFVASFVGVAPINDPKIVILVIVDEPDKDINYQGGQVAAPIAGEIIEKTLKYLDVEPQFQ